MNTHYSPIHHGELTNHLPMYQHAMTTLGVADETINLRTETYVARTELKDLSKHGVEMLPLEEAYLSEVEFYKEQLANKSIEVVIKDFLKDKSDTMASALFHGMIRLAFAIEKNDLEEIARALSYFHVVAKPMDFDMDRPYTDNPTQAWNNLMASRMATDVSFDYSTIMLNTLQVVDDSGLKEKISQLVVNEDTEKRIGYIIARWYMKTRDFYVLHLMTGYYALLQLKPFINDFDEWLNKYWQMAQVISLITTERLPIIEMSVNPWDDIIEEARAMTDVHDVKLFYACKGLDALFSLKIYNKVAHIVSHKYWGIEH